MSPSDMSDQSDSSGSSNSPYRLLPRHGGYRKLRSFQTAQLVYDGTLIFCDRFIDKRSRTHDQMVQAARSGVQNIAEGSVASGTSKKTELKLTNVARASLEELLLDYQDFLRQRGLRLWAKDSPEALAVRRRYQSDPPDQSERSDPHHFRSATPEVAANTLICLINQASYLLGRQLENLDQTFLAQGGFTERLHAARTRSRASPSERSISSDRSESSGSSERSNSSDKSESSGPSDASPRPACPRCGRPMVQRIAKKGPRAGLPFWGCSAYPDCTGTRPVDFPARPDPL
jgi:four helix bundle suffix protein